MVYTLEQRSVNQYYICANKVCAFIKFSYLQNEYFVPKKIRKKFHPGIHDQSCYLDKTQEIYIVSKILFANQEIGVLET